MHRHLLELRDRHVRDGAVLAVDNATGEILAYLGGSGDLSSARYVDGVRAMRQAGSTLKPFLYALAFEKRLLTAASLLEDSPLELPSVGGFYRPENYDRSYRGLVTVRTALASSLNIPAVKTLQLTGVGSFVSILHRLGFEELLEAEFYGPSLALGSADVTLWDLVNAYRTLATGGRVSRLHLEMAAAASLHAPPQESAPIIDPRAAFIVSTILSDKESRRRTFGWSSPLATRFWAAVKTGTSKDMRDNWCVGYSELYTLGVWVGNFSGEPMWDVSGISGAAPVWVEVMEYLHRDAPSLPPVTPPGVVEAEVLIETPSPQHRLEYFLEDTTHRHVQPAAERAGADSVTSPQEGTVFAFDPDIPPNRQRILFRRSGPNPAYWNLDGRRLARAPSDSPYLWAPVPGRHQLDLIGSAGQVLDAVSFEVR